MNKDDDDFKRRDVFATAAVVGLCSGLHWSQGLLINENELAADAVAIADALIAELDKPKKP